MTAASVLELFGHLFLLKYVVRIKKLPGDPAPHTLCGKGEREGGAGVTSLFGPNTFVLKTAFSGAIKASGGQKGFAGDYY